VTVTVRGRTEHHTGPDVHSRWILVHLERADGQDPHGGSSCAPACSSSPTCALCLISPWPYVACLLAFHIDNSPGPITLERSPFQIRFSGPLLSSPSPPLPSRSPLPHGVLEPNTRSRSQAPRTQASRGSARRRAQMRPDADQGSWKSDAEIPPALPTSCASSSPTIITSQTNDWLQPVCVRFSQYDPPPSNRAPTIEGAKV